MELLERDVSKLTKEQKIAWWVGGWVGVCVCDVFSSMYIFLDSPLKSLLLKLSFFFFFSFGGYCMYVGYRLQVESPELSGLVIEMRFLLNELKGVLFPIRSLVTSALAASLAAFEDEDRRGEDEDASSRSFLDASKGSKSKRFNKNKKQEISKANSASDEHKCFQPFVSYLGKHVKEK